MHFSIQINFALQVWSLAVLLNILPRMCLFASAEALDYKFGPFCARLNMECMDIPSVWILLCKFRLEK